MKRWILASRIEPPDHTVSGRFGSSVMFCAYSRFLDQWHWIYPSGMEKISEPHMLFLDEAWAREHPRKDPVRRSENPLAIHRKSEQLLLF
jgi:hypothetical protein